MSTLTKGQAFAMLDVAMAERRGSALLHELRAHLSALHDEADRLQSAHDAEVGALREDAAKWRNYCAGRTAADTSHVCRSCGHPYTPADGESEDCPKCGHDGGAMEGEDG